MVSYSYYSGATKANYDESVIQESKKWGNKMKFVNGFQRKKLNK